MRTARSNGAAPRLETVGVHLNPKLRAALIKAADDRGVSPTTLARDYITHGLTSTGPEPLQERLSKLQETLQDVQAQLDRLSPELVEKLTLALHNLLASTSSQPVESSPPPASAAANGSRASLAHWVTRPPDAEQHHTAG